MTHKLRETEIEVSRSQGESRDADTSELLKQLEISESKNSELEGESFLKS